MESTDGGLSLMSKKWDGRNMFTTVQGPLEFFAPLSVRPAFPN